MISNLRPMARQLRPTPWRATRTPEPDPPLGRPARVVFVTNALGGGGAERQLTRLAIALDRDRFAPAIVTLDSAEGALADELRDAGIHVTCVGRRGRFDVAFVPRLVSCLRGADVVHGWLTPGVCFGLTAARLARVPVVVGSERGSAYRARSLLHRLLVAAESRLLDRCDGVVANSEAGLELLRRRGVRRPDAHVVYNALPSNWPPPGRPRGVVRAELGAAPGVPVVLVAASLTPKKDHAGLLAALVRLADLDVRPMVLLAGTGPLEASLRMAADRLGLGTQVRFLGHRSDVADLLCASDLAVLPSCEREGCSNFLMEAMSLAVPVVTTDAGGSAELITHGMTGLVVPCRRPRELADAMERVLATPELARRLGENAARVAASRFALRRMVAETESLVDAWLTARHPAARRRDRIERTGTCG